METPRWKLLVSAEIQTVTYRPWLVTSWLLLPHRIWPFLCLHAVRPHSSGQYSGWPLFSDHYLRGWYAAAAEPRSTRSFQAVSHPSTILAQCCLTSVFIWELLFPTWHRPLTSAVLLTLVRCIVFSDGSQSMEIDFLKGNGPSASFVTATLMLGCCMAPLLY